MRNRAGLRHALIWLSALLLVSAGLAVPHSANAQTVPSVIAGGPYTGAAGFPISFGAQATPTAGASVVSYVWSFGDGVTASGQSVQHTYTSAGAYTVVVTVVDSSGATASATAPATVSGSSGVCQGIPLTGVGSNAACIGSSPCSSANVSSVIANCVGLGACTTIVGANGAPTFASCGAQAQSERASAGGPYSGPAQQPITLTGAASASAGATCPLAPVVVGGLPTCPSTGAPASPTPTPLTYRWNFGDGQLGQGPTVTHIYAAAGAYTISLTVTFSDGSVASGQTTATISAPLAPRSLALVSGCNNVALTFPDGTPPTMVAAAVSGGSVISIWALISADRYAGYFPGGAPSDLTSVNRLSAAFICVQGPGTLNEPGV